MNSITRKILPAITLLALPVISLAQNFGTTVNNISSAMQSVGGLISLATSILVGVAILVFIWGLVKFIINAGDPEKRKEGKQLMLWGLVALVVIASLGAIISLISNTFGIGTNDNLRTTGVQGL